MDGLKKRLILRDRGSTPIYFYVSLNCTFFIPKISSYLSFIVVPIVLIKYLSIYFYITNFGYYLVHPHFYNLIMLTVATYIPLTLFLTFFDIINGLYMFSTNFIKIFFY